MSKNPGVYTALKSAVRLSLLIMLNRTVSTLQAKLFPKVKEELDLMLEERIIEEVTARLELTY